MPIPQFLRLRDGLQSPAMLLVLALIVWTCAQTLPPPAVASDDRPTRVPVVFVPGVTGVGLIDAETKRPAWGTGGTLMRPHDLGYGIARSVSAGDPGPRIVPGQAIRELRLFGVLRFEIYQSLVDSFVAAGYRLGDLAAPESGEDFFLFAYDWRQDNIDSAILLNRQLEGLRQQRSEDPLSVDLICQSNGAHVCRYFAKYGDLTLEEAESGRVPNDRTIRVRRLILVGASNGGSIRVLRELDRGRRYLPAFGRRFSPEALFTFVSLFQDLPIYSDDLFVDWQGERMEIDLFDAEAWERFGWSVYGRNASRRLARERSPAWLGNETERREYLVRALDRARRFHRLLARDAPGFGSTRAALIENDVNPTASRAVLRRVDGEWQTLFADDKSVRRRRELQAQVEEPGDGHATTASQQWLSAQERADLERRVVGIEVSHRQIILQPETHRLLLEILAVSDRIGR